MGIPAFSRPLIVRSAHPSPIIFVLALAEGIGHQGAATEQLLGLESGAARRDVEHRIGQERGTRGVVGIAVRATGTGIVANVRWDVAVSIVAQYGDHLVCIVPAPIRDS